MILHAQGLSVRYGQVPALQSASIEVPQGAIVTVIGPNGAGKTTLLNALMGMLPALGEVRFDGRRIDSFGVAQRVALGLSLVPERGQLFGELSVEDNLRLGAYSRFVQGERHFDDAIAAVYRQFPQLDKRRNQPAATLSGGERQMLALGRALMAKPRLLMLDEPSLGLAPLIVRDILRTIAELRAAGVSILLVEQNARAALQISDHAYVLENGAIALHGSAAELACEPRVVDTYLGLNRSLT